MNYEFILTHIEAEKVGVITLNRPKQLNALSTPLMIEVGHALRAFDQDEKIGAIILQGNEKAFAAGADIQAMSQYNFSDVYNSNFITRDWETINSIRKPVIAAVSGFALGGGCELAMMCDLIFASESAKFGQPEIKLGIIPGAGGTQRLPRAVGKARTMDMVLTGSMMSAQEALQQGLVSRVVPQEQLFTETLGAALTICSFSRLSVMAAKESVNKAFEGSLSEGMHFERRLFHSLFSTQDQKEGMDAFLNKRAPTFKNQ